MRIIWVATTGNDGTGDGSYLRPYRTIEHGVSRMTEGDQVRIMDGTYTPTDSILVTGISGSIFAENPLEVYIQPTMTVSSTACIDIRFSERFTLSGINVLQATTPDNNPTGINIETVTNFLAYKCRVSQFVVPTVFAGYGIYANALGRIEDCTVDNFQGDPTSLYGIMAKGPAVVDCTVASISCDNTAVGIAHRPYRPTEPPPPPPPPPTSGLYIAGTSLYQWGTTLVRVLDTGEATTTASLVWETGEAWAVGYTGESVIPHVSDEYDLYHRVGGVWSTIEPHGHTGSLCAIWGADPYNVWVGGVGASAGGGSTDNPRLYKWNGSSFNEVTLPFYSFGAIYGITGYGINEITVVGADWTNYGAYREPVIFQYNGTSWTKKNTTGIFQEFTGVWGTANNNLWICAAQIDNGFGAVFYYNGSSFDRVLEEVWTRPFFGIHGTSETDIWVVGDASIVAHYDGATWLQVAFPVPSLTLSSVYAVSATEVYVIGYDASKSTRYIFRYNGSAFIQVYGAPGTAGETTFSTITPQTALPTPPTPCDVWMSTQSGVFKCSGGVVTREFSTESSDEYMLSVVPLATDNIVAVGASYDVLTTVLIYYYDGGSWTRELLGTSELTCMSPADSQNIWAGGNDYWSRPTTYYYNGSYWSQVGLPGSVQYGSISGIIAFDSGIVYAVGGTSYDPRYLTPLMYRYDSGTWTQIDLSSASFSINDVWGSADDSLYLVGNKHGPYGVLYSCNGDPLYPSIDLILDGETDTWIGRGLTAIWGISEDNIWAVGESSVIAHYNGDDWIQITSPVSNLHLTGVWGSAYNDIFIVGWKTTSEFARNYILHWNGYALSTLAWFDAIGSNYVTNVRGIATLPAPVPPVYNIFGDAWALNENEPE